MELSDLPIEQYPLRSSSFIGSIHEAAELALAPGCLNCGCVATKAVLPLLNKHNDHITTLCNKYHKMKTETTTMANVSGESLNMTEVVDPLELSKAKQELEEFVDNEGRGISFPNIGMITACSCPQSTGGGGMAFCFGLVFKTRDGEIQKHYITPQVIQPLIVGKDIVCFFSFLDQSNYTKERIFKALGIKDGALNPSGHRNNLFEAKYSVYETLVDDGNIEIRTPLSRITKLKFADDDPV
ncbi:hypothetical protein DASC09_033550 [Saccharomycopsis crataegensis]|uniref:Uncharacterized protein n=1 Tax=Saccharomycopsis crataegensis TaxID=43959 RepID=A0AAV5QNB2_9ASCO|nr:hypothetical protein DASC09_033550 [Saccharomycopsis crataegensis]